jgi:hypothetical protein
MDQHDQELLDKQFRHLQPTRDDGATVLMLLGMFFAGMTFGSIWFGHQNLPTRLASNDVPASSIPGNETSLP